MFVVFFILEIFWVDVLREKVCWFGCLCFGKLAFVSFVELAKCGFYVFFLLLLCIWFEVFGGCCVFVCCFC